ncbi:6-phosphofructokinase [Candidatus Nitrosacidococcus tergens]|uniref:Pyrophosphate--fructose 6-phosphate 1-phosphotransferase n=1 Tax=Candidatus Nitrosacidococcus tergens TaxID=553981 RepID=A0A7G1QAT1_9GAMM|nr:6-phosphofructokinase [Candidatus Nitrosacidococcus tergens]CAB1276903.1 Phosphofructokinase [Candidatus Nitrosacidococcus tergens]
MIKNAFYAQSGGVTAVINASACGVIETARKYPQQIGEMYAGHNGIIGALTEDLIDTSQESDQTIAALRNTPGGAFGSCRYKLKGLTENKAEYEHLIEVFKAHNIGYFFYNGGGDSQDTAYKVSQVGDQLGYPIICIGIPKTIDNDLAVTDNCPGFGSVAKYVALSTQEAALDVASMALTSTKVFILEVMGRHAGWIAAAGGLGKKNPKDSPHIILFPEIPFQPEQFFKKIDDCVKNCGYCMIVASEGVRNDKGEFLSATSKHDSFGHVQLGGLAPVIANMVQEKLGYKYHWAVADYLQRSARHIASQTDVEQAYEVGKAAVEFAIKGENAIMPTIVRTSNNPYRWEIGKTPLKNVANIEKKFPLTFITPDGFGITEKARTYLLPLIYGEDYPPYKDGLPDYAQLKRIFVPKKLNKLFIVSV